MSEFLPDFNPDFGGATIAPSPNHGERQGVAGPDIILLHYTGMTTADGALSWLCNPESQVSSHYFVFEDGRVMQLVAETRRAWPSRRETRDRAPSACRRQASEGRGASEECRHDP